MFEEFHAVFVGYPMSIYKFGLGVLVSWCLLVSLFGWVFVCLFGCLYPINVKTAEPMVPKLCEGPKSNMTQKEGLRTIKITKNVCSKVFDFCKSLNMHEQILEAARTFRFVIV